MNMEASSVKLAPHSKTETEEMEVKIISEELVKPSSAIPPHLKTFKLSFLDQLASAPHGPVVLFYPPSHEAHPCLTVGQKISLLKRSLSRTLAHFYPLAGKISEDGPHIECDDDGARFVEARVNISLNQFLTDPDLLLLHKLIPCEYTLPRSPELVRAANIQVNIFRCGGLAVAVCNTHKLHDGMAVGVFLKGWARGGLAPATDLTMASRLFPAKDLMPKDLGVTMANPLFKHGNCVTKRFLFSRAAIEALRARGAGPTVKNPTWVEAVSGFLWKCIMDASRRNNNGFGVPSTFTHLVNIRPRMNPPLPESSIGNLIWLATANYRNNISHCAEDLLPCLVGELRGAISKVDGDFLLGLSRGENLITGSQTEEISGEGPGNRVNHILCSSWGKFGFYNVDFGWGRPVWVSSIGLGGSTVIDFICLIETRSGSGIEAWVTLDEPEMSQMQEDPELQSFASVNPSPLTIGNSKL